MTTIVNNAPPLLTTTATALAEPEEDQVTMIATVIGDAFMSEIEGGEGEAEEVSQSEIVLEVVT